MPQKLLLTGGSGMVGRNIQNHPAATQWEILAPSSRELDLTKSADVENYIAAHKPDLVVHAAGKVGGIQANMAEPVAFLDRNVMIGRNVIMGARAAGVKRLVNLASTCIYPRHARNPLKEEQILTGNSSRPMRAMRWPRSSRYGFVSIFGARIRAFNTRP